MKHEEVIVHALLQDAGLTEVLASRYPDVYKPYDLQPIRKTDHCEKNRVRKSMTPIPDFHPHPTDKYEYWDWMSERALERWQTFKDRNEEREEAKKEQREEVIRVAQEAWGDMPMISLREIHKADEKLKEPETETAEARVASEFEEIEPFILDNVKMTIMHNDRIGAKHLISLFSLLARSRKLLIFTPRSHDLEQAIKDLFKYRTNFSHVVIIENYMDGSEVLIAAPSDEIFDKYVTKCIQSSIQATKAWRKYLEHCGASYDD
jgi:hypothetical protein